MPLDDPVPYGDLLWAARREVDQHRPTYPAGTGGCSDCKPDGTCDRLAGARLVVAQHEAAAHS